MKMASYVSDHHFSHIMITIFMDILPLSHVQCSFESSNLTARGPFWVNLDLVLLNAVLYLHFQRRKTFLRLRKRFLLVGSLLNTSYGSLQLQESPSKFILMMMMMTIMVMTMMMMVRFE